MIVLPQLVLSLAAISDQGANNTCNPAVLAYLRIAEANCTKVVPADPDCASRIATHGGFKPLHPKFAPDVDAYNFTAEWHASVLTIDAKLNYTVGPDPNISYQMTLDNDYDSSHHDYKEGETSGHPQTIVLAPKGLTTVTVTVVRKGSVDTPPCNASYAVQIGRKAVPPPKKNPKRSKAKNVRTGVRVSFYCKGALDISPQLVAGVHSTRTSGSWHCSCAWHLLRGLW